MSIGKFYDATGIIEHNMMNDYMFRVILQENRTALKGLLCSLLRLRKEDILSVNVCNPIKPGETIDMKEFYMDMNLLLNDNSLINLEMQVVNEHNWTDRALSYTCRSFLDLQKGQDYSETKSVVHVGFLDYTLFSEHPEFYAIYKLMNVKTHHIFSDKFTLGVVNLRNTDLATEEDRAFGLDIWAKLFRAQTWEELKMLSQNKPELVEVSQSIYEYNSDLEVRQRCIAREEHLQRVRNYIKAKQELEEVTIKKELLESEKMYLTTRNEQLTSVNEQLTSRNESLTSVNEQLTSRNESLTSVNEQLTSENMQLTSRNEQLLIELQRYKDMLENNSKDSE